MNTAKKLTAAALAATLLLGLCACGAGTDAADPAAQEPDAGIAVQIETAVKESISTETKVSGKIAADNETSIFVAATTKCTATYKEAGDQVTAGDVICTLDLGSTLASYSAAQISYDSTVQSYNDQKAILDKQVALAEKTAKDTKALFDIGAASQLEVEQAELAAMNARAGRETALAQLEAGIQSGRSSLAQLDLALENVDANGNVVAPMSGTLVSMSAVANSFVSSAMPVAVIDGVDQMKVTVSVSEALVPKLTMGDSAEIAVSAISKTFTGTIRSVEQAASAQTKLYTVTLTVPSDVEGLLGGMFADVTFRTDTVADTITVPTEAVLTDAEGQYVFLIAEDGATAKRANVTTGLTGNGVTELTSGVEDGQQVVTVGQSYLSDGDSVRIVAGEE